MKLLEIIGDKNTSISNEIFSSLLKSENICRITINYSKIEKLFDDGYNEYFTAQIKFRKNNSEFTQDFEVKSLMEGLEKIYNFCKTL